MSKKLDPDLYKNLFVAFGEINKCLNHCKDLIPISRCFDSDLFWQGIERQRIYERGKESFYHTIDAYNEAPQEVKIRLRRKGFNQKTIDSMIKEFETLKDF